MKKLTGLVLGISLLLSCSNQNDNRTEITFWHSFVSHTIPALNEIIELYEKENPDVKILAQYVPSGDPLIQKLVTAIQSGTTPDIAWVHADFLDKLVAADAIYKMNYFIKGPNGLSELEYNDIFPQLLANAKWRDTLYAMPLEATNLALLYNKDLFRKAGLDPEQPPQTWGDLIKYAELLTLDENEDGINEQYGFYIPAFPASGPLSIWMLLQWEPFLWQAGGKFLNDDQTQASFNNEAGIKALTLWKELYDKQNLTSFSLTHNMGFVSGKVAMIMDGSWDLPQFREINNFEWGIAPLPAGPVKQATYLAGEHLTIFKNSDHPGKAWEFVKWFVRPDIQAKFSIKSGYLPVRTSTIELPEYKNHLKNDKYLAAFVEQMKIGMPRQNIDFNKVEINQIIAEAVEKTLLGNVDVEKSLNAAAEKVNKILLNRNQFYK